MILGAVGDLAIDKVEDDELSSSLRVEPSNNEDSSEATLFVLFVCAFALVLVFVLGCGVLAEECVPNDPSLAAVKNLYLRFAAWESGSVTEPILELEGESCFEVTASSIVEVSEDLSELISESEFKEGTELERWRA